MKMKKEKKKHRKHCIINDKLVLSWFHGRNKILGQNQ